MFFTARRALAPILVVLGLAAVPASAATTQHVNYTLSFLGHTYFDAVIYEEDTSTETGLRVVRDQAPLAEADDIWGLPRLFPEFSIGDTLSFSALLSLPDLEGRQAGTATFCRLGGLACDQGDPLAFYNAASSAFALAYGPNSLFYGILTPGSVLSWDFASWTCSEDNSSCGPTLTTARTASGDVADWGIMRAQFAVIEVPAPIPLPASALLLPVGLAGLAALRRRRKGAIAA